MGKKKTKKSKGKSNPGLPEQVIGSRFSIVDKLEKFDGTRPVEEVFSGLWIIVVKTVAFAVLFFLMTSLTAVVIVFESTDIDTLSNVNSEVPEAKFILFGGWLGVSCFLGWLYGVSHQGKTAFHFARVGLVVALVVSYLLTMAPVSLWTLQKAMAHPSLPPGGL